MEYQVYEYVEVEGSTQKRALETFESAYHALDFMAQSWFRGEERASRLYLLDSDGCVLLTPDELQRGAPMTRTR